MLLSDEKCIEMIKKYGIDLPRYAFVKNKQDAINVCNDIGFPITMKISGISHKTDVNGVIVDLRNVNEIEKSFDKLIKITGTKKILIQKHVHGISTIIGGILDSQFGPCVSFGSGGIFTEILRDINFRVCPINKHDAECMIKDTKINEILSGARGKKYFISGIQDCLLSVSKLMMKEKIKELDINPLIVNENGVKAVDIRIVV